MTSNFLANLQRLRHWCPPSKPVVVYRVQKHPWYGALDQRDGRLIITIRIDDDPREECETLIHEWAHALTYNESRPEEQFDLSWGLVVHTCPLPWVIHGDEWGAAYARCYRAVRVPVTSKYGPDHDEINYCL